LLAGVCLCAMPAFLAGALDGEIEPNNSPATANPLQSDWLTETAGAIMPAGDADYFRVNGINIWWASSPSSTRAARPPATRAC